MGREAFHIFVCFSSFFFFFFCFFPSFFSPRFPYACLLANNSSSKGVNSPSSSSFLHLNKVLTSRPSWDHLNCNIIKHSSLTKVRGRKEHFNPFRASFITGEKPNSSTTLLAIPQYPSSQGKQHACAFWYLGNRTLAPKIPRINLQIDVFTEFMAQHLSSLLGETPHK